MAQKFDMEFNFMVSGRSVKLKSINYGLKSTLDITMTLRTKVGLCKIKIPSTFHPNKLEVAKP